MTKTLTQPLKWHGGKAYLADWIISLMPPRCQTPNKPAPDDPGWLHYVEPFFGGGAVLLAQDPEGISEVVNDINHNLTMFWRVLQSPNDFLNFRQRIESTPFSRVEFERAEKTLHAQLGGGASYWEKAAAFFIHCRQSMAGRMDCFAPLTRNRVRGGMNEQASAWLGAVEGLAAVHARLKRVVVLNDDAVKVIKQQDGPRTLFYCDPPYLHETRTTKGEYGDHEMDGIQHAGLLETLRDIKGKCMLSGYHSRLYDECAASYGWNCHEMKIDNKASSKKAKEKKTECVWCNF